MRKDLEHLTYLHCYTEDRDFTSFKIINGFDNIDPKKFFTFNDNNTRGHLFRLEKQQVHKSLRLNSFPLRCINEWNSLPEDIVCKNSVESFKVALDKLWLNKRFDTSSIYKVGR